MRQMFAAVILCIVFQLISKNIFAVEDTTYNMVPRFILVQLSSEHNRAVALEQAGLHRELKTLRNDAANIMEVTVRDFGDNFDFCPVYYYIDTNYQAILDQKFEGVLLTENLSPAREVPKAASPLDYLIVYFGAPVWQTNRRKWAEPQMPLADGRPNGLALIINNYKLKQVSYLPAGRLPFYMRKAVIVQKYKYESRKFDIEYIPMAAEFNRKFVHKQTARERKRLLRNSDKMR